MDIEIIYDGGEVDYRCASDLRFLEFDEKPDIRRIIPLYKTQQAIEAFEDVLDIYKEDKVKEFTRWLERIS